MEVLVWLVVMFCQHKFSFLVNCEDEVLVQNGVYFVKALLVNINMWVDIRNLRFLRLLLWPFVVFLLLVLSLVFSTLLFLLVLNRLKPPELILSLVNIVLQNLFSIFSFASSNIKSSVSSMSLDQISLIGPLTFLSSGKSEPTACMFASISHNLSSVVLFVLKDAKSTVISSANESVFVLLAVNVKDLTFISFECSQFNFIVLYTQTLVFVKNRYNFV